MVNVPSAWLNTDTLISRSGSKAETVTPSMGWPEASTTLPLMTAAYPGSARSTATISAVPYTSFFMGVLSSFFV